MAERFDRIIFGAGLYGLYAALFCAKKGMKVLVLETDSAPFQRATYVNQARVHMGYHYPRSLTTALKSAGYFRRFMTDYGFSVHKDFLQIYGTSSRFSYTSAEQFREFCAAAGIYCRETAVSSYFQPGVCDGAFLTEEYTYDAMLLREHFMAELAHFSGVKILFGADSSAIGRDGRLYRVTVSSDSGSTEYETGFILNATYASVNQILKKAGASDEDLFDIKYELCEIILCKASDALKGVGITVMDGPFFSIMPFGKTGFHSLTAVTFTPHMACHEKLPAFRCQNRRQDGKCDVSHLGNCDLCPDRPESSWPYMSHLADKYLLPELAYTYEKSLFSMKPILKSSEVDDSRPTAIRKYSDDPVFVSVLSGKINTVYDLDEYLE